MKFIRPLVLASSPVAKEAMKKMAKPMMERLPDAPTK